MSKFSNKNYSLAVSAAIAASALIAGAANAQASKDSEVVRSVGADSLVEQVQLRPSAVAQNVTSVSQLSDVRPTDWAFTALQSLVERYGCIAGYPDRTFRGKQATSRYEFAAGLNACLDKINEIISAGLADKVSKEDLATLQKLQEEFAAELATLRGRVDALDAKTAKLEAQQFSTTTKLRGEAIFGLVGGSDGVTTPSSTNIAFNYRVRLNLDTSFTGKDLLRTRLQASNTANFTDLAGSNSTRLSWDGFATSANSFEINRLYYRFPVGDNLKVYVAPIGALEDVLDPLNPLESDGQGTISRFGRFSPLTRIASRGGPTAATSSGSAIAGFAWTLSDKISFQAAYTASNAAAATGQGGITGGDTKIAAQFVIKPSEALTFGVGYANAYTVGNSLGSGLNVDSIGGSAAAVAGISGITSNTVVGSLIWDITKKFTFNTWGAYTFANSTGATTAGTTFTSWLAAISAKDLFTEGDLAALSFGQPLLRTGVSGAAQGSTDTPYHLEALYRFRVSKNISITPGVYFVFNQNSASANGTATVGVIRTTFSF
ncbi:iron uptake porin [Pseudanabaena sp. UWO311]|uniref:iron uptake porin n=1 Tax=Pseudanabaena sp. UWO311 TaxID=2487337 RepID=UPI001157E054|nr:iron uptake porin [Pseudanabaena sp. UWO311]TYQ27383.1 iron uptake porin [Pseudanabaena sp. UWO311]